MIYYQISTKKERKREVYLIDSSQKRSDAKIVSGIDIGSLGVQILEHFSVSKVSSPVHGGSLVCVLGNL